MNEELKEAYAILRAKDEIIAEKIHTIPSAMCVAVMGIVAIFNGAFICAAIALSCAAAFALAPWAFGKVADWLIGRLGYTEIELERLALG